MRLRLALVAFTMVASLPATSRAQDVGALEDNVNSLRQKFQYTADGYRTQYDGYKRQAAGQNSQVDQLVADQKVYNSRNQVYDNVISLRSKDALQKWIDDGRARLDASELSGYSRLGKDNPYDPSSYIRWYDKDGKLVASEVRNSYEQLQQQKQDWEQSATRLRDQETKISDSYQKVLDGYKQAAALKQQADTAQTELNQAKADAAAAERERQRLEAEQDRPRRPTNVLP